MKTLVVLGILMAFAACNSQVQYLFPSEMKPSVKRSFLEQCKKGKMLYDLNCSNCHTKEVNGRKVLPVFSPLQLANYELRTSNKKHMKEMSETKVSAEDLGLIMVFFTYKKS